MKIKKLPNSKKVILEFDEWLQSELQERHQRLVDATIEKLNELAPRRTAYNMWEFKIEQDAQQALFILGLKL
jgi:hypothetical protein